MDELADLVEVVYAILKCKGVDIDDFESIRKRKTEERELLKRGFCLRKLSKDRSGRHERRGKIYFQLGKCR